MFPQRITAPGESGLSYVEVLITVAITGMIVLALMGVVNTAAESSQEVLGKTALARDARAAMTRMVDNTRHSSRLLLPLRDNPSTNWPEDLREQTQPATAPVGDSSFATAVLAVTLPWSSDLDGNGVPDADNDADGRFDEDPPKDNQNDGQPGIALIDDDGDGGIDNTGGGKPEEDNDEDGDKGEDPFNLVDDDGDGSIDEDYKDDLNDDGQAGIAGIDDDIDGAADEGSNKDDDEDGSDGEDWFDPVVYSLVDAGDGSLSLIERWPVPWDENLDTKVDGEDYRETVLATNVTRFRVERLESSAGISLVDITLTLTSPENGDSVTLQTRVRVGSGL